MNFLVAVRDLPKKCAVERAIGFYTSWYQYRIASLFFFFTTGYILSVGSMRGILKS